MSCIIYNGQKYSNDEFANLLLSGELEKLSLEKKVDTPITKIGKEFSAAVKKIIAKFDRKMEMEKAKYEKALKSSPDLVKLRNFLKKDLTKNSRLSDAETRRQAGLTGIETANELKNRLAIINNAWRTTKTRLENEKQLEINIAQEKPVKATDAFSLTRILRSAFGLRKVFKTKDGKRISQDEAAATLMDKVLETIAKRQNVTKQTLYNSTFYKRSRMEEINNSLEILLQAIGPKGISNLAIPDSKVYVNVDGKKRSEISDSTATFKFDDIFSKTVIEDLVKKLKAGTTLSSLLYHDALYKAYPELASLKISSRPLEKNEYRGYFTTNGDGKYSKNSEIVLNSNGIDGKESLNIQDMMSTLLHEVQHAIQLIEGFEQGLDTDGYRKVVEKDIESTNKLISLMETANENQTSILNSTKDMDELDSLIFSRAEYDVNKVITESDIKKAEEYLLKASQLTYNDYMEMYMNTLEEIEARTTEYRQTLTQEEIDEFSNRLESEKNISKKVKTSNPKIFKNFEDAIFYVVGKKSSVLFQDAQAAYQQSGAYSKGNAKFGILEEGEDLIHAMTSPNVSSPLHETAHKFEKYLTQDERQVVLDFAETAEWTTKTSEKFARGFEKFLSEGNAPSPALQSIFEAFASWLMAIYNGIIGSDIDIELNDEMRKIYSAMLGSEFISQETKQVTPAAPIEEVKVEEVEVEEQIVPIEEKTVEQLRADEKAEYDAMIDPNDEVKKKEIYEKYNKLITPLLEKQKQQPVTSTSDIEAKKDKIEKERKADKQQNKDLHESSYIQPQPSAKQTLIKFREYLTDVLGWEKMPISYNNNELVLDYLNKELRIPAKIIALGGGGSNIGNIGLNAVGAAGMIFIEINVEDVIDAKYDAELAALEQQPAPTEMVQEEPVVEEEVFVLPQDAVFVDSTHVVDENFSPLQLSLGIRALYTDRVFNNEDSISVLNDIFGRGDVIAEPVEDGTFIYYLKEESESPAFKNVIEVSKDAIKEMIRQDKATKTNSVSISKIDNGLKISVGASEYFAQFDEDTTFTWRLFLDETMQTPYAENDIFPDEASIKEFFSKDILEPISTPKATEEDLKEEVLVDNTVKISTLKNSMDSTIKIVVNGNFILYGAFDKGFTNRWALALDEAHFKPYAENKLFWNKQDIIDYLKTDSSIKEQSFVEEPVSVEEFKEEEVKPIVEVYGYKVGTAVNINGTPHKIKSFTKVGDSYYVVASPINFSATNEKGTDSKKLSTYPVSEMSDFIQPTFKTSTLSADVQESEYVPKARDIVSFKGKNYIVSSVKPKGALILKSINKADEYSIIESQHIGWYIVDKDEDPVTEEPFDTEEEAQAELDKLQSKKPNYQFVNSSEVTPVKINEANIQPINKEVSSKEVALKNILNRLQDMFPTIKYKIVDFPDQNWKGRFHKGVVEINFSNADVATAVHEYLHPFIFALKSSNKELYDNVIKEMKSDYKSFYKEVMSEISKAPEYSSLTKEQLDDEVLVRILTDKVNEVINPETGLVIPEKMDEIANKYSTFFKDMWNLLINAIDSFISSFKKTTERKNARTFDKIAGIEYNPVKGSLKILDESGIEWVVATIGKLGSELKFNDFVIKARERVPQITVEQLKGLVEDIKADLENKTSSVSENTTYSFNVNGEGISLSIDKAVFTKEDGKYKKWFNEVGDVLFLKSKSITDGITEEYLKENNITFDEIKKERNDFIKANERKILSMAYDKAIAVGGNIELVKAVDEALQKQDNNNKKLSLDFKSYPSYSKFKGTLDKVENYYNDKTREIDSNIVLSALSLNTTLDELGAWLTNAQGYKLNMDAHKESFEEMSDLYAIKNKTDLEVFTNSFRSKLKNLEHTIEKRLRGTNLTPEVKERVVSNLTDLKTLTADLNEENSVETTVNILRVGFTALQKAEGMMQNIRTRINYGDINNYINSLIFNLTKAGVKVEFKDDNRYGIRLNKGVVEINKQQLIEDGWVPMDIGKYMVGDYKKKSTYEKTKFNDEQEAFRKKVQGINRATIDNLKVELSPAEIEELNWDISMLRNYYATYESFTNSLLKQYAEHFEYSTEYMPYSQAVADSVTRHKELEQDMRKLAVEWLFPYFDKLQIEALKNVSDTFRAGKYVDKDSFAKLLRNASKDNNKIDFLFGTLVNTDDPINATVAILLSDVINKNTNALGHLVSTTKSMRENYFKSKGITTSKDRAEYIKTNFLRKAKVYEVEKDEYGKIIIDEKTNEPIFKLVERWAFNTEYNMDEYEIARKEFIEKLAKPIPPPMGATNVEWAEYQELAVERTDKIKDWELNNKERFKNKNFERLMKDEMYRFLYTNYESSNNLFGEAKLKYGIIQQGVLNDEFIEKNKSRIQKLRNVFNKVQDKNTPAWSKTKGMLKTGFTYLVGQDRDMMQQQENPDGSTYKSIKTSYLRMLKDDLIDFDLTHTITGFTEDAMRYSSLRGLQANVENLRLLTNGTKNIDGRKVPELDANGSIIWHSMLGKPKSKDQHENRLNKQLNYFIDRVFYGEKQKQVDITLWKSRKYEENLTLLKKMIADKKTPEEIYKATTFYMDDDNRWKTDEYANLNINLNNIANKFTFLTSVTSLAGNLMSTSRNLTIGNFVNLSEGNGNKYYSKMQYAEAAVIYTKNVPQNAMDLANNTKSKLNQVLFDYQAIQGEFRDRYNRLTSDQGVISRLFSTDTLFFLQHVAEHQIQGTATLAMMLNTSVKLKDGTATNLWDALTLDKNGVVTKENIDPSSFDETKFIRDLHEMNRSNHGNYSDLHKTAIQREWYGGLLMTFRKHMYPVLKARFGKQKVDYSKGVVVEGFHRTFFKKIVEDVIEYGANITAYDIFSKDKQGKGWTSEEEYSFKRATFETFIGVIGMMILTLLLAGGEDGDDDDDSAAKKWLIAAANGLYTDIAVSNPLGIYNPFTNQSELYQEFKKIGNNPVAVQFTFKKIGDFIGAVFDGKDSETIGAKFEKIVPVYRHLEAFSDPEEYVDGYLQYQSLVGTGLKKGAR